jgi:hypothetical protein
MRQQRTAGASRAVLSFDAQVAPPRNLQIVAINVATGGFDGLLVVNSAP